MFNPYHYPTLSYNSFKIQYESLINKSNYIIFKLNPNIPHIYNLLIKTLKQQTKLQKKYPKYFSQYQKQQHQQKSQTEIKNEMIQIQHLYNFLFQNNYQYNQQQFNNYLKQQK